MTFATINTVNGSFNEEELARLTPIACDMRLRAEPRLKGSRRGIARTARVAR